MHMPHKMITPSKPHFRGKISSLLEDLLAAAVTEICELFDNEFASLRAECPRCKHSREVERRTQSTPHRNSSSKNVQRFTTKDNDPPRGISRGEVERDKNGDVGLYIGLSGTHHSIPQCSQRDISASNKESEHASQDMGTKMELVSVKQEVIEEFELQREEQDEQEEITSSDIALPDPNLDLSTSLSPHTGLEWAPPETFTHSDTNCDPKIESETGHSSSTNRDEGSENSGQDIVDYYHEQQSTWNSDMAAGLYQAPQSNPMQHRDCSRVGHEEVQREEVELGNAHFTHWTASPLRSQSYLHRQWSRHRKSPGSVSVFNMSLSGAVSLDMRAGGSGNQLNMSFTADQEKRFTCLLCGKRLLSEQTLKSHQKIHTGFAPHQCNQCGKRFSRLENLKVHQNIHTGLKPYTCKFCLKKFNAPSNFNRHKRACLKRKLAQFSSQ